MNIKHLLSISVLVATSAFSQAEIKSFETNSINSFSTNIYPNLDLNGLDKIKINIDQKENQDYPHEAFDIKRVEFNFPNANNLVATNFKKLVDSPNIHRAVVTSPWVFKKVMVEILSHEFHNNTPFNYRVIVMDNTSNINNIEQANGIDLLGGDAQLVNTSVKTVVDVIRTRYLNKPLTLRLFDDASYEGIQIEAIWMGHGRETLILPVAFDPRLKPVTLLLEESPDPMIDDKRIKVRLDNAYHGPETPDESLRALLEHAFGPLPYPETPQI
jgi:hypothetical protein